MAPMTRSRADNGGNNPTDLHVEYYTQRADAGLIITEGSQVSKAAVGYINTPGIYSASQVDGWRKVTDSVHAAGGKIFIQLWHVVVYRILIFITVSYRWPLMQLIQKRNHTLHRVLKKLLPQRQ